VIVVGSKGLTGASRFVLGSVASAVSHHAPCDVLIVQTAG
jgi:nucleotide-binding universal stress UspA family protein